MDLSGICVTAPIWHTNVGGVGIGAGVRAGARAISPTVVAITIVTVTAATVFLAANQAAATTTAILATTLPTVFNIHNLKNNVKACHQSHLYLSFLMTKDNIQRQRVEKTNLVDTSKDSEPITLMLWMYLNGLEKTSTKR